MPEFAQSAPDTGASERESIGYTLAVLMLVMALVGLGLAYGLNGILASRAASAAAERIAVAVAGRELSLPRSAVIGADRIAGGFAERVGLSLDLALAPGGPARRLTITLVARSAAQPSATLLDSVYLQRFSSRQVEGGPPGLVGKPLLASDGYAGETVWYDPLSVAPFVAKCASDGTGVDGQLCVRTVPLAGNLAAILAFDAAALADWRSFDRYLGGFFVSIGALETPA